jgi:hypothetical protein
MRRPTSILPVVLCLLSVGSLGACGDQHGDTDPATQQSGPGSPCGYCAAAAIICTDEPGVRLAVMLATCEEVGQSGACMVGNRLVECEADPCGDSPYPVIDRLEERMPCAGIASSW